MLFVGTSIIHPSTEGVFLLCNILDLLIYSFIFILTIFSKKKVVNIKLLLPHFQLDILPFKIPPYVKFIPYQFLLFTFLL